MMLSTCRFKLPLDIIHVLMMIVVTLPGPGGELCITFDSPHLMIKLCYEYGYLSQHLVCHLSFVT